MSAVSSGNWGDRLERAGATFVQSYLSVFIIGDMSTAKTAFIGAGAAVLAMAKAWAKEVLDKRSA